MNMASLLAAYRRSVFFSILAFFAFFAPSLILAQDFTGDGPFEISTEIGLRAFAAAVNDGDDFSGKTVRLTSDITLTGNWVPIGNGEGSYFGLEGNPFKGIFDGQYHKIFELYVNKNDEHNLAGLFGFAEDAEIKNIGVINANVTANGDGYDNDSRAGILIGHTQGSVIISNSYATGEVSGYYWDDWGGMIWLGGLVGYADGSLVIENSYAITVINGYGSDDYDMNSLGGFVGAASGDAELQIKYSYAISNMSAPGGEYDYIGGILGYNMSDNAEMISVYYKAGVDAKGEGKSIGGTALTDTELKTQTKFAGFDFEDIWGIDAAVNQGYPHLLAFHFDPNEPITCPEGEHIEGENCVPTPIRSLPQLANQISVQTTGKTIMLGNLPGNAKVEMYNLQGKRVYAGNSANLQTLSISVQAKGFYIVKVSLGSEKKTLRVSVM
jgi:hypothetical protein